MGIGRNIKGMAKIHPNKIAIKYEDNTITYGQFYRTICQIQHYLQKFQTKEGSQKVAILIGNEPAFLELFFAAVTLGWTAIPFDSKWSKQESFHIMKEAEPDLIITSRRFSENTSYVFNDVHYIETIKATSPLNSVTNVWEAYSKAPFYLGFTSGSTGVPKGFIRSHNSWLESFFAAEQVFHYNNEDTILAPGPLCHSLSLFGSVHTLHIGATLYLTTSFDSGSICKILGEERVTVMYAVPSMLYRLAQQPTDYQNEKKLTMLSSGAKLSPEMKEKLQHVFPKSIIYEYYGASELSFVSYSAPTTMKKYPDSVGKAFPTVRITIRNEEGQPIANGETGKVFIESEFLFSGYVNNPKETNKVLTQHGATVGDLGFLNFEGILTIIGRENNMIISGGLNIYPEEVESIIREVEAVKEVIVVGIADDYWGQKVIALINWNYEMQLDRLKLHCKTKLATYKCPKEFYEVDTFPYTTSGKIARNEVELNIARYRS